jgi:hypothetical protein
MADPIISPEALKLQQDALTNLRDIRGELEAIANRTKSSVTLARTFNSIEAEILQKMKGQSDSQDRLLDAESKMLLAKNKVLRLEKSSLDVKRKATEEFLAAQQVYNNLKGDQEKINKGFQDLDKRAGGIYSKFKEIKDLWKLQPELVVFRAVVGILKQIWSIYQNLDTAAAEFRKSMGFTRADSVDLESMARSIVISYMRLGVSAKDVYDSIHSLADTIGSARVATEGMVKNMSLLAGQLGISTKISAQFLKTMAMVGKTTMDSQKDMLLFAQHMSAAVGVPLDAVMEDVAEASESMYQYLSRSPLQLVKAAIEAKSLGTSLSAATKTSASLLNFTESVKGEMEASVLLGHSLNLQRARELAYHRDIVGLNREIVRLAKQAHFEDLDPFQQDAVARALGKSAGEVATMLQADKEHQNVLKAMTAEQRKQYDGMVNANKSQVQSYAEKARAELQSMSNQKATAAITLAWHSIFAQIGEVILPHVANILTFIAKVTGWISSGFAFVNKYTGGWGGSIIIAAISLRGIFKVLGHMVSMLKWISNTKVFANLFDAVTNRLLKVGQVLFSTLSRVFSIGKGGFVSIIEYGSKFFGLVGRIGMGLLRFLNPITKIAAAFQGGWLLGKFLNQFKFIQKTAQDFFLSIFAIGDAFKKGIVNGLFAVGKALTYALFAPFMAAYNMIMQIFGGHSPSKLGLSIVTGIVSVEGLLINALVSPFRKAWEFIKKMPLVSHLFGHKNVSHEAEPELKAGITVDRPVANVDAKKSASVSDVVDGMSDELAKKMGAIVDAINSLRDDMKNGVLTANVYIDSQKLDSAVGRRLAYTGTLT